MDWGNDSTGVAVLCNLLRCKAPDCSVGSARNMLQFAKSAAFTKQPEMKDKSARLTCRQKTPSVVSIANTFVKNQLKIINSYIRSELFVQSE